MSPDPHSPDSFPSHASSASNGPSATPGSDKLPARKQTRRVLLIVLGVLAALVTTVVAIFLFYDIPMPDDSALRLTDHSSASAGNASNPLGDLVAELRLDKLEEMAQFPRSAFYAEPGTNTSDGKKIQAFLAAKQSSIAAWENLMRKPGFQDWRWPADDAEPESEQDDSASVLRLLADLVVLQSKELVANGNWEQALGQITDLMKFGSALRRLHGTHNQLAAGSGIQINGQAALKAVVTSPGVPSARLAELQSDLSMLEPQVEDYQRVIRVEYQAFKEGLIRASHATAESESQGDGLRTTLRRLLMKEGMTCTLRSQNDSAVIVALGQGWINGLRQQIDLRDQFKAEVTSPGRRVLSPNPLGDERHFTHVNTASYFLMDAMGWVALHRQIILQLALRRFELDQQKLPPTLDSLVPVYLPSVPLDPFTGGPMLWDPANQIVYSVGTDFIDNKGSLKGPPNSPNRDTGLRYWWAPNNANPKVRAPQAPAGN